MYVEITSGTGCAHTYFAPRDLAVFFNGVVFPSQIIELSVCSGPMRIGLSASALKIMQEETGSGVPVR